MGVYDTNATRVVDRFPARTRVPRAPTIRLSLRPRMALRALSSGVKSGAPKRRRE